MSWWLSHHPNNILVRWERLSSIPFQKIARHFIIWNNHWNQTQDVVAEHKQIKGLLLRMAGWLLCTAQTMDVQGPPNKLRNCGQGGNILIYEIRARLGLAWSWQKLTHRSWWGGSKRTNQAGKPGFSRVHTCIVGTSSHTACGGMASSAPAFLAVRACRAGYQPGIHTALVGGRATRPKNEQTLWDHHPILVKVSNI